MKAKAPAGLGYFVKRGRKCRKGFSKKHKRIKGRGMRWMCVPRKKKR